MIIHAGYLLKSINDKLKEQADLDLQSQNLTFSQSRVVLLLSDCGGAATQKELEDKLMVSHPTVVGLVSRMKQNGMVRTYFDKNSKSKVVTLTEQALQVSEHLKKTIYRTDSNMLQGLSDEEVAALEKALKVILKNLE